MNPKKLLKGLIVMWPDVPEGQTAPMIFTHEKPQLATYLVKNQYKKKVFNLLATGLNEGRYRWVVIVQTKLAFTNKRTGAVTEEWIKSTLAPDGLMTLYDLCEHVERVQKEDDGNGVQKVIGRKINCYCKGK